MRLYIYKNGEYDGHYEMSDILKFYSTIGGFKIETIYGDTFFSYNDGFDFEIRQ